MESQKPATTSWGPLHPNHSSGEINEEESPIDLYDNFQRGSTNLNNKLSRLPTDQPPPTIYKVHTRLRNVNNDAYEPTIVAIGPYHRKNEKLQKMVKKKLQFLQQFLDRGGSSVEVCFSTIKRLKPEPERWYDEPINLDPTEFVEMLVVDGCFIIEFVLKCEESSTGMPSWMDSGITHDLMLFENQIPYCVISELYSLTRRRQDFSVFVLDLFRSCYPMEKRKGNSGSSKDDIKHLLELLYRNVVPMTPVSESTAVSGLTKVESTKDLDLVEKGLQKNEVSCCKRGCIWCSPREDNSGLDFINTATTLSKFDVKFRRGEPNDSMFQINFENGTLRLPCLEIDDDTESFFRNLIAYEQYFESGKNCYVNDFQTVFDCLVNDGEDVKLLVKYGIIKNMLGSEDVVAHMINKLGDRVIVSSEDFMYKGEFKKLKEHCKKRRDAWMAKLKRDYFNSPWTLISVIAAFILLLLTVLQTVFTIK